MKQSQQMRKNKINDSERVRFTRDIFTKKNRFARLDIPVAIFAPEKPVKRRGRIAESVFVQRDGHFADGRVQLEQNPFVITRKQRRFDFALHFKRVSGILPEVLTFAGSLICRQDAGSTLADHLAEAARVPELVAEVAAQFDVLFIEQNILAERRGAHHAEAQRIRAELRDEVERVGRIAEALGHLAALLVTDDAGEINILERQLI